MRFRERPPGVVPACLEGVWIACIAAAYLTSFGPSSPAHGPDEIFDQDSPHLVGALAAGTPYPWNPQHHLLFHVIAEDTDALLPGTRDDPASAIRFLRWLPAIAGLGYLIALRLLLAGLGLGPWRRIALLSLGGFAMAAWGGFALIETYALAMPFFMLYLACMRRVLSAGPIRRRDHAGVIVALAGCAWARLELAGLAGVTLLILLHPGLGARRRALAADLVAAAVLIVAGSVALAMHQLDASPRKAVRKLLARGDRATLAPAIGTTANLGPGHLLRVARAATVYAFLMPAGGAPREEDVPGERRVRYFTEPAARYLDRPLAWPAVAGVLVFLGVTAAWSFARLARGDPFFALLAVLWVAGLLFYAWFNPREPYLWIQPFAALAIAAFAAGSAALPARGWTAVAGLAALIGAHNAIWFRQAFQS
jgi:hypothetical protein